MLPAGLAYDSRSWRLLSTLLGQPSVEFVRDIIHTRDTAKFTVGREKIRQHGTDIR